MAKQAALLLTLLLPVGCGPRTHQADPVVTFVETNSQGRKIRVLKLALTSVPAGTCTAGDWKMARVLQDESGYTRKPAYTVRSGALEVMLITSFCDRHDSYIGTVSGNSIHGDHVIYGWGTSKTIGTFSGSYSHQ